MTNLKFLFLFLSFGLLFVSCDDDDDTSVEPQEEVSIFENLANNPDATLLYETVANVAPIETYNAALSDPIPGKRLDFQFDGDITGQLNGSFVGYDYATFPSQPGENLDIDVFGTITTTDNVNIAFRYKGESFQTGPLTSDIQETGYLSSNHPDYAYLNDLFIIPIGDIDLATNRISVKYYAFDSDPFNGENPYAEKELPDYSNFPFTWENIQEDDRATLVYEATVSTTGMDGFGTNPTDFFTGAATIPSDGARVDIDFAGTTEGELNGNISGTDYIVINPDGSLDLNVRGKIETPEGAVVSLKVNGMSLATDTPGISHLFETAELRTNHEDFSYLNDKFIIGVGINNAATNTLTVRLYRFDENPLN